MNKKQRIALLSHAVIILSLSLITFFILDIYNPMMGFLSSRYSRVILCLYFVLSLALGIVSAAKSRRSARRSARKVPPPEATPDVPADR